MSEDIYLAVRPVNPTTPLNSVRNDCTHVMVTVHYMRGHGIVASAYPLERIDGTDQILIASGATVLLKPATRLNRKRLDEWKTNAAVSAIQRSGLVWDLVLKVCDMNGLEPAEVIET